MPTQLPPGPYSQIECPGGATAPFYMVPFDKRGVCEGPETRRRLVESVQTGVFTDVFVFCHGWNNDWRSATTGYRHFIDGYLQMQSQHALSTPAHFRPLLVGLHWPSAALVLTDAEQGPSIAADDVTAMDAQIDAESARIRDLADPLSVEQAARFYALLQQESLSEEDGLELARLVGELYTQELGELPAADPLTPEEIMESWFSLAGEEVAFGEFGGVQIPGGGPGAAGSGLRKLDPRQIVRMLTVYQMKDRAGVVGAQGVSLLLRDLLDHGEARVHAVGHSYGCRVLLSAVSHDEEWPRPLASMLLLQPAISHLCFADQVPDTTRPGGYRPALRRVRLPILATYSAHDLPLHDLFHLILRRERDVGEMRIAAAAGEPPSRYAALGGYGPRHSGEMLVDVQDVGAAYDLDVASEVIGIDGTRTISGHGDYSNPSTWWALYNLVMART